ncbi:hypothetical protein H310_09978, partial [Aphanomyces invadans]
MYVLDVHDGGIVRRPAPEVTKEIFAPPGCDDVDRGRLHMRGSVVEWRIAHGHVLDRTFKFPQDVLDIAFVDFNGQNDDVGHSVCVLAKPDRMTVISPSGSIVDVPLPFQATSIWAMQRGVLLERSKSPPSSGNTPVLFSLMHPLDEIKPVMMHVDASQRPEDWAFVTDPVETLVYVDAADPPFLAFYHPHRRTYRVKSLVPIAAKVSSKSTSIVPELALHQIWESPRISMSSDISPCKLFVVSDANSLRVLCLFNPSRCELCMQPLDQAIMASTKQTHPREASFARLTLLRCRLACPVLGKRTAWTPSWAKNLVVLTPENEWILYQGDRKICRLGLPTAIRSFDDIMELRECPVADTLEVHTSTNDPCRVKIPLDFTCALLGRIFDCMAVQLPQHLALKWRGAVRSAPQTDWDAFTSLLRVSAIPLDGEPSKAAAPTASKEPGVYEQLIATLTFRWLAHDQPKIFGQPRRDLDSIVPATTWDLDLVHELRCQLPTIFSTLHALYEDLKLSTSSLSWLGPLGTVLHSVALATGLVAYAQHYVADLGPLNNSKNEAAAPFESPSFPLSPSPSTEQWTSLASTSPPCIYGWLQHRMAIFYYNRVNRHRTRRPPEFSTSPLFSRTQHVVALFCKLYPAINTDAAIDNRQPSPWLHYVRAQGVVHHLVTIPSFEHLMDDLPDGVALPLRYARTICTHAPGDLWDAATCHVIQRPDWVGLGRHDGAIRSAAPPRPLMADDDGFDDVLHWHAPLFPKDHRLKEVARLLRSNKIMYLKIPKDPTMSDADVINMQQARLLLLCKRSMALPVARGMVTFGSLALHHASTSLTSPLGTPPMPLAARIAESNAKIHLDSSTYKELMLWPQFHNGVATALRLPSARHATTTVTAQWIFSHKPKQAGTENLELTSAHAGFLLGLGLLGHLNQLSQSAIFQYLSVDHELTSVGLLLGLAATTVVARPKDLNLERSATRILSLHIPSMLPPTYSHVNITPSVQTAALIGLGLVYQSTGNRNMTEMMLSEIVSAPVVMSSTSSQPTVDLSQKEGYALAAGMAVGLIALGRRSDPGLADLNVEAKLVKYMVGGSHKTRQVPGNCILRTRAKSATHEYVDMDVTAAGSALALAFMYLQSNNDRVRKQLEIPNTVVLLEALRPDLLFVRVVSSNLVAWDAIQPSLPWIEAHQPTSLQRSDVDAPTAQEAYANILAGACFSIGLKYAGSHDPDAKALLLRCISDYCEWRSKAKAVSRVTCERCLGVLAQSVGLVMAGSGDLATLQALRVVLLRQKADAMADVTYGNHMSVSSALGLLFLGGGRCSLKTTPFGIAMLVIALYPMYPCKTSDQKYHLQALRHLYVLAIDSHRFVETINADTGLLCPVDVAISKKGTVSEVVIRTPHLLPAFDKLAITSTRHFPITVDATKNENGTANACRLRTLDEHRRIYVKCKRGKLDSPQLTLLQQFHRWFVSPETPHCTMHAFCKRVWLECQMQHKPHVLSVYLNAKHTEAAVLDGSLTHSLNVATLQLMHLHMELEAHVFQYEEHTAAVADVEGITMAQLVNEDFILGYTNALLRYFTSLGGDDQSSLAHCAHRRFSGDPGLADLE